MRRKLYLTSSAAIALAMAAQGVSIQPTQAQDADSDFAIEEIIVTARKREENIQDAPLSIAAFTSNMIESANINTLDDIAKFTAGFSFDEEFQRSDSVRPVIRGQSTILGETGVSFFIDGILITGPILDYDLNDVERIEIIKGPQSALYGRNTYSGAISIITKSPTDELSGQAKVSGGEFDQYEASASVRGPVTDTISIGLTGRYYERGGPFINTFDNTKVGQQQSKSLSGVVYFNPSPDLDIRLRARWSELEDDQPRLFTTDPSENNCFFDNGGAFNGNGRYFCGEITEHPISIDDVNLLDVKGFTRNTTYQSSLSIDYAIADNVKLTWIHGYNELSMEQLGDFGYNDESLNPFSLFLGGVPMGPGPLTPFVVISDEIIDFAQALTRNSWDYSSEFRIAYEGDNWDLLVGGYFFTSKETDQLDRQIPTNFGNTVLGSYLGEIQRMVDVCDAANGGAGACSAPVFNVALGGDAFPDFAFAMNFIGLGALRLNADQSRLEEKRTNNAGFAMLSRDVTDALTLTGEVRVEQEKIISTSTRAFDTYAWDGVFLSSTTEPTIVRQRVFTSLNPRFTARYAVTGDSNLYGVVARGTKPGGFNDTEVEELGFGSFDEESVWSYEVGAKNVLMDGRLIVNVAAFQNTIENYQLSQSIVLPSLTETTTVIANVGKVRLRGLELEMVFAPVGIPGLVINANYAFTDSEILEGTDVNEGKLNDVLDDGLVNCSLGRADPTAICDDEGNNTLPGSIVGRQLPRQAKHMYNVGVNYTRPVTDDWSVVLNANVSHESKKFVQVHNLAWVGSNTLLNASVGVETGNIRFIVWGKNLTDEDAVVSASRFADEGASFQRIFMGNPRIGRQFGATATYKF